MQKPEALLHSLLVSGNIYGGKPGKWKLEPYLLRAGERRHSAPRKEPKAPSAP